MIMRYGGIVVSAHWSCTMVRRRSSKIKNTRSGPHLVDKKDARMKRPESEDEDKADKEEEEEEESWGRKSPCTTLPMRLT